MNKRLKIFEVKSEYIQYLSNYQKHLFLHTNEKDKRKYIGKITPKGMPQIFLKQDIPVGVLGQIFAETLG